MSPSSAIDDPRAQVGRGIRLLVIALSILLFLLGSLVGAGWLLKHKAERARARWKAPALERLAGLSLTNEEVRRELDELKGRPKTGDLVDWTRADVLLMTNGEYIIYAFRHGANSGFVDHLFLGHGSDGRWLYSTYHFCGMMAGVAGDDPPGSIKEFSERYSARTFDGKSDDCLRHTWPLKK